MKPQSTILGVDLGGTKTAIALYDANSWEQIAVRVIPTNASEGFPVVIERVLKEMEELLQPDTMAVGFGIAGYLDYEHGSIRRLPNIPGGENFEVRRWLSEKLKIPVVLENDAGCFAYAEALRGAGIGHKIVLGVTLGTGVGGGIVINGEIFHGAHGHAGEVGHMLLRPGTPPYKTDDVRGDIEQFLSGTAMGKRCEAASSPTDYLQGQACSFMHPEIIKELAWFVCNVLHVIDPSIIVFGGSTGRALGPYLPKIETELKKWVLPGILLPKLVVSHLSDAAVLGAAMLAKKVL